MKLIKNLTDIDVIHCPTEEVCRKVGKMIGNDYWIKWNRFKSNTCLRGKFAHESLNWYKAHSLYKDNILDGQDFINFNTKPQQLNYILW